MSSDNAIERVRELLDERGVKHVGNGGMVRWTNGDGCVCRAFAELGNRSIDVAIMDVSPEQAVAATLGRGTCHDVYEPTVEDVLQEFTDAILEWAGKSDTVAETGTWSDVASEYVDRIRKAVEDA